MPIFRISPARLLRAAIPRQAPRIVQASPIRFIQSSPARHGFWETGYNTPSRQKIGLKYWGLFYFWAVVSGPTFMIMLGNWPGLLAWFADKMRPVEYPPQADPTIIKTIYKNQVPKRSSMDSYRREGSKHPEVRIVFYSFQRLDIFISRFWCQRLLCISVHTGE